MANTVTSKNIKKLQNKIYIPLYGSTLYKTSTPSAHTITKSLTLYNFKQLFQ